MTPHELLILYRHAPAAADELRWCLRSLANVRGCNPVPLVVGDPPSWYIGPKLEIKPVGNRKSDVTRKLRAIIASELVAETFVLLADDNAVVKPIDFDDLLIPRRQATRTTEGTGWQALRYKTCEWLRDLGLTNIDVSTHWPYGWEKSKLAATLELIGDEYFLIETAYANQHGQSTRDSQVDFRYMRHARGICEDARVISYDNSAFLRGLRSELHRRFPKPCPWETGPVPSIPTLGVIDRAQMYACESLGEVTRVEGKHVIFTCKKLGEATLFTGHTNICEQCVYYQTTNRTVTLGRLSRRNTAPKRRASH